MYGFPKGSLLFNIDLNDMPLECDDDNINSYAFDTIPYSCTEDVFLVNYSTLEHCQKISDNRKTTI